MKRGSNMPAVGTYNQTLVLDIIRRSPSGVSRTELAELTGLSAQTLSNVARRLTVADLIVEGERVVTGPGKPRTLLRLNRSARFAVGIHLDPSIDTFVVVDLSGAVVAHMETPPDDADSSPELIAALAGSANALLKSADVPFDRVLGIGAAVPGPIDDATGMLLTPPLLPNWHHTRVRDLLIEATGLPVVVEKDVVAAMVGELWADADHALRDAALLYYGAGVGLGVAIDGDAVRGRTGNAGDIAHLSIDPSGPPCQCGQHGCLGVTVAPERLLLEAGVTTSLDIPWGAMHAAIDDLRTRAQGGDSRALAVCAHAAEVLARAIVLMNNMLDAGTFVIGGPVWSRLSELLEPRLRAVLPTIAQIATTRPLRLVEARLGTDLAAAGAACLVLDGAFTARTSGLMISAS
ncbi:ROK family transcriptional regulator [Microbacterium sp. AK031]|uniref:ROK family transcriptional regulator n=1 Tax=Microbacterium sp. AK031 TaxID=2723076 RepID=UPI00216A224B|nr:ROK family transcriptional regulator [Microbacterium sp. AK031]MCS3842900.1 putative NBD/HSP70 family sugar kinase [Microbacterium sp. AK031]